MVKVSGGDKLDKALREIAKKLQKAKTVSVGWPEGSTYPDGTSMPMVASVQEYGAPSRGIPPRPFMRNTIAAHGGEWPAALITALKANGYDAEKALGQLGEAIAGQIRQSIVDLDGPALSAVTVMLRGMRSQARYRDLPFGELISEAVARVGAGKTNYGASTKPLVDSGRLLGSIVSTVE